MSEILRPRVEPPQNSRKSTQTGMTDRRLEVRETPGERWKRLMGSSVHHKLVFEQSAHDPKGAIHTQADDALKTLKDEFRHSFFRGDNLDSLREQSFDALVDMHVAKHYQEQARRGRNGRS